MRHLRLMLNRTTCLLVSYTGLGVNSTEHAMAFGCGLARLGWSVRLATAPIDPYLGDFSFFKLGTEADLTPLDVNERLAPADIVHIWTPRTPIWRFLETHGRLIGGALVLHLEDDEDEVLALFGDGRITAGGSVSRACLRALHLDEWAHPDLARCLAHAVDGITILSPELAGKLPKGTPVRHVLPPLAPPWIGPVSTADLPADVSGGPSLVYAGGVHAAVADDFLELCSAVGSLAQNGHALQLLRCGPPAPPELIEAGRRRARNFCDFGHLPVPSLRALLAQATVLVQPGGPSAFNRRRFPSKLVPYLASGTPVVMPACYDWTGVRPDEHAKVFSRGDAADLARAIVSVLDHPDEARRMAARAAEFARMKFDLGACCDPLEKFYATLPRQSRITWRALKKPRVELPLIMAAAVRAARPRVVTRFLEPNPIELQPGLARLARSGRFRASLPSPSRLTQVAIEELRQPALAPGQSVAIAQFYWPTPDGINEDASDSQAYLSGRWRCLVFGPNSMAPGKHPRLDPGNRPGLFEIAAISYRAKNGQLLERLRGNSMSPQAFTPAGTITPLATRFAPVARWLSTGTDPQLFLRPPRDAAVAYVECWIKWTPLE